MKSLEIEDIYKFLDIQSKLLLNFYQQYPDAKDIKWLLDFPKAGTVKIDNESWEFFKHGAGLRFVRKVSYPHMVIDVHKCVGEKNFIDVWRIIHFCESVGISVTEEKINSLLSEMCSRGDLLDQGHKEYLYCR
jgi:hypothetical protein